MQRIPVASRQAWLSLPCVLLVFLFAAFSAAAQQTCPAVRVPPADSRSNMFTGQQEMDVGDAIAEQVQREFLVIDDEDYTSYVQRVGNRLLEHAPPTDLKIQFFLFDLPIANAMSLPGGRVYVSRKLVAMTRDENELAGILGHELGHVLTHQPVIKMSELFRGVLGVTQPGNREEIFKHYQDLQDNIVRKHRMFERGGGEDKQEQLIADQIGMQLISAAGYNVQAFSEVFDRIADTKGKTGNWLSDLFGATSTESRRLREILKRAPLMACAGAALPANGGDYQKWRTSVVSYSGLGHKEHLQDVIHKMTLTPPLVSDLQRIRFSRDGKYLLAQNEASIFVLDAASFEAKFTIHAPEAHDAWFSADSQRVIFYSPSLRMETWSVADEARISASEIVIVGSCVQTRLSPDARYLACLNPEYDLAIYNTESSEQVFQKKHFYALTLSDLFALLLSGLLGEGHPDLVHMRFSPDGRYFVAHSNGEESLALNVDGFRPLSLPGSLRNLLNNDFDFVGPDQIVGIDRFDPKIAGVMKFPSGEWVKKLTLGRQRLETATDPRYVMLRPVEKHALGLMDLDTGKLVGASDKPAGDVGGGLFMTERVDGDLGAFDLAKRTQAAQRARLPLGELGELQAFGVSPDLHWLAMSGKTRGAEWDLLRNERVFYLRGFKGATVGKDGAAEVDCQKFQETTRHLLHLDPENRQVVPGTDLDKVEGTQFGSVFLKYTHNGKSDWKWRNVLLEVQDARTGAALWSRNYPKEAPDVLSRRKESLLVLSWAANSEGAKLEIRGNAELSQRWPKVEADATDYFLEAVDPHTGHIAGASIVRTGKGSFKLTAAEAAGEYMVAADGSNRLHVISLKSGEQKGLLFGRRPTVSEDGLLAAENERGQLSLFELRGMTRETQYVFTNPVTYVSFASDHRRMLVLTGDQSVYFLKLPSAESAAAAAADSKSNR